MGFGGVELWLESTWEMPVRVKMIYKATIMQFLSKREVEEVLHCTEGLTSFLSSLPSLGQDFRCFHSCLEGRGLSSPGQPLGTYLGG